VFFVVVQRWLAGDREAVKQATQGEMYGPPAPLNP
jgi:hypothetical protein